MEIILLKAAQHTCQAEYCSAMIKVPTAACTTVSLISVTLVAYSSEMPLLSENKVNTHKKC